MKDFSTERAWDCSVDTRKMKASGTRLGGIGEKQSQTPPARGTLNKMKKTIYLYVKIPKSKTRLHAPDAK